MQQAEYDTWSGPRAGLHVGVGLAARWRVLSWLDVRAGIRMTWRWLWLLNSTAEAGNVTVSDKWQVTTRELSPGLDLEVTF